MTYIDKIQAKYVYILINGPFQWICHPQKHTCRHQEHLSSLTSTIVMRIYKFMAAILKRSILTMLLTSDHVCPAIISKHTQKSTSNQNLALVSKSERF